MHLVLLLVCRLLCLAFERGKSNYCFRDKWKSIGSCVLWSCEFLQIGSHYSISPCFSQFRLQVHNVAAGGRKNGIKGLMGVFNENHLCKVEHYCSKEENYCKGISGRVSTFLQDCNALHGAKSQHGMMHFLVGNEPLLQLASVMVVSSIKEVTFIWTQYSCLMIGSCALVLWISSASVPLSCISLQLSFHSLGCKSTRVFIAVAAGGRKNGSKGSMGVLLESICVKLNTTIHRKQDSVDESMEWVSVYGFTRL